MSIFFYTALLKDIYRNFETNKNKKFNKIYFWAVVVLKFNFDK